MELTVGRTQKSVLSKSLHSRSFWLSLAILFLVVSLGELVALILQYQNNRFFRDYLSENALTIASEVFGVLVVGLGSAYLAYHRSARPRLAKGPGVFHRLGDIVTHRHKAVIILWLIVLLASVPLATMLSQALTSQTSTNTANPTESVRAQQLMDQVFPHQTSNSSALIVIVGADVTDNATKQFVLNLEARLLTPGELTYVQNFTSIYSTERTILVGGMSSLIPAIYGLQASANSTAFLVYGVPSVFLQNWIVANRTDPSTADRVANSTTWAWLGSLNAAQQLGQNALVAPGYFSLFSNQWAFYASNGTLVQNPTLRATTAIKSSAPLFAQGLPNLSLSGFIKSIWQAFSLDTYNQFAAIHQFTLAQVSLQAQSTGQGSLSTTFLQSVYNLGPSPSLPAVQNLAEQTINTETLSTYPFLPSGLVGQFISPKKDTMLVIVSFTKSPGTFSSAGSDPVLKDVLDMRKAVSDLMGRDPGPSKVYVTGNVATTADASLASSQDIERIDPITIGAILVLVGVFFVAIVTPFVPLAAIGLALVTAQALVFLISKFVVPVQSTTLTFLTTIMLGVGTDYAIFLIARYREERVEGKNRMDSVHTSVKWVGESISTSGSTVILAFGAMALGSFSLLRSMGIAIGTGVLIALLVSLTLIPALLSLVGDRVFWPNSGKRFEKYATKAREKRATKPSYFRRAASFSARRPKLILLLALIVTIPATYVSFTTNTTYDFVAGLPKAESVQGLTALEQSFGAGRIAPTQVVAQFPTTILQGKGLRQDSARALEKLSISIAALSDVAEVTGPTRPEGIPVNSTDLTRLNPTDAQGVLSSIGKDNRTAVITVILSQDPFTSASLDTIQQIRNTVSQLRSSDAILGSAEILVGGSSASTSDFAQDTINQFTTMRIVVISGIFVILLLVLGSYILPVAAILSIGMSIIWSYAATIVFFKSALNSDVLFLIPLILFLLLFGIGMDYNIFILTRIREEAQKGKGTREAVVDAVDRTGGIITALALILGGALGSLMLSSNRLLEGFGFAIALAVVLDAMVVRTYIVPAMMSLLGPRAWWGPSRLRRVKPETTIAGSA